MAADFAALERGLLANLDAMRADAVDLSVHIDLSGPFFTIDPKETVEANVHRFLIGLSAEGERIVKNAWTGSRRGREGVTGRVANLAGKPWQWHATVTPGFTYPWHNKGARGFAGSANAEYRGGKSKQRNRAFKDARYRMNSAQKRWTFELTGGVW
jgi:hypothetical protein